MAKPRILFITPAATRSGAPMLLLHTIRWMKQTTDLQIAIVLVTGGAMAESFAAEVPTEIFYDLTPVPSALGRWVRRRPWINRRAMRKRVARCRRLFADGPPDLIYCNSAAAIDVMDAVALAGCPVIMHLHELEYVLRQLSWIPEAMKTMSRRATHYIACAEVVKRNLVAHHGIVPERVTVIYEFIPTEEFLPPTTGATAHADGVLAKAGIPRDAAVVGIVGTVEWRKGVDLFIPLVRQILSRWLSRPVYFVWVGGGLAADLERLQFDITTAGLQNQVKLIGPTNHTADWYRVFTVFALLSREDPFPLAGLEAAAAGVPLVCFEGGGGMVEFVESDAGRSVPFLNLESFASAVTELIESPGLREQLGRAAARKVRARHDVSVAAPQIVACIRQVLEQTQSPAVAQP